MIASRARIAVAPRRALASSRARSPALASTSSTKLSRAATPRRVAATPRAAVDAERTVREMYERINARDVDGALACVDENVVYEDFQLSGSRFAARRR